jgi:hypothetical protein
VSVGVTTSQAQGHKKEILSDDFKKRKIFWKNFRTGKFSMENFPPHITTSGQHTNHYTTKATSD